MAKCIVVNFACEVKYLCIVWNVVYFIPLLSVKELIKELEVDKLFMHAIETFIYLDDVISIVVRI